MGLKENIKQAYQQVQREREIQAQLREQKSNEVKEWFEKINQKASQIALPYLKAIDQSNCIPILNELIQMEKLTEFKRGNKLTKPNIEITFEYRQRYLTVWAENNSICYTGVDLKNDMLDVNNLYQNKKEKILNINPESLWVCDCHAKLEWGEYETVEGYFSETTTVTHVNYIEVSFKKYKNKVMVEASNNRKTFINVMPEDLNKESMEKTIARLYAEHL